MPLSLFKPRSRAECKVVLQDGVRFTVRASETLLDAALAAGLDAPYNCRVGACRTCRCEVLQGEAKSLVDRAYVLEPQDLRRGVHLACQTRALSDLVVRWERGSHVEHTLAATVSGLRRLTPRVWRVSLATERAFHALPGQYIGLHMQGDSGEACVRPYSIIGLQAGALASTLHIDVARRASGRMSGWLTEAGAIGRTMHIAGPFGDCVASGGASMLVAIGAGSGIGAACGALMHSHAQHPRRPTLLLAYGATAQDLYGADDLAASALRHGAHHENRAWAEALPIASTGVARGRAPLGLEAIAAMPDSRVLIYGPSGFVDACTKALHGSGLDAEQIRFDRYQSSDSVAASAPRTPTEALTVRG